MAGTARENERTHRQKENEVGGTEMVNQNYYEAPTLHWYITKQPVWDCYMSYWKLGNNMVGFMDEPEPKMIDKYNLKEIGVGDYHWLCDQFF